MFFKRILGYLNHLFKQNLATPKQRFDVVQTQYDAISEELNRGQAEPYSVQGSVVVIQFLSAQHKFEQMKYLEICSAYNAKIMKESISEIALLFKESNADDHQILALSFLRDFIKLDPIFSKTIKCFIDSGILLFDPKKEAPDFSGQALNSIKELIKKDQQGHPEGLIFINQSLVEKLSPYGVFLKTDSSFYVAQKLTTISEVLETFQPLESAAYFRNAEDLAQTIHYLSEKIVEGETDELRLAFAKLLTFRMQNKNQALLNSYKCLLNLVIRLYRLNPKLKQILSACISIAKNILAPECFDDELRELLNWCLQFKNPRIKANTIEALGYFDPNHSELPSFSNSKFNRVAAESIIIQAKKALTDELTQQIITYLKSGNPFFVASGLYIIGDICLYYFNNQYEVYLSNPNFKKLIDSAKSFKTHSHSMVRKRALETFKIIDSFKGAA